MAVGEEEEGLREKVEVWEKEIGTWSSMSKSKGITARIGFQTIGEVYMPEAAVKLHIADNWLSTGTWRKLSI